MLFPYFKRLHLIWVLKKQGFIRSGVGVSWRLWELPEQRLGGRKGTGRVQETVNHFCHGARGRVKCREISLEKYVGASYRTRTEI